MSEHIEDLVTRLGAAAIEARAAERALAQTIVEARKVRKELTLTQPELQAMWDQAMKHQLELSIPEFIAALKGYLDSKVKETLEAFDVLTDLILGADRDGPSLAETALARHRRRTVVEQADKAINNPLAAGPIRTVRAATTDGKHHPSFVPPNGTVLGINRPKETP